MINSEKKLLINFHKLQEKNCLLQFSQKEKIENSYNQKERYDCIQVRTIAKKEKAFYLKQAQEVIQ
jgi:hypothetical protein